MWGCLIKNKESNDEENLINVENEILEDNIINNVKPNKGSSEIKPNSVLNQNSNKKHTKNTSTTSNIQMNISQDTVITEQLKRDRHEFDKFTSRCMFYHADVKCRKDAKQKLKSNGATKDGVYMIRHSTSCAEDFVLSFTFKHKILHLLIRLIEGFYQLDGCLSQPGNNFNRGLNGLIETYTKTPVFSSTHLTEPCAGGSPPPPLTLYTNLHNSLRESVELGDSNLAHTILSHRLCPNLDYRNSRGDTALHHASEKGLSHVVNVLLLRGACAHATNHEGLNSLHLACQFNHPKVIRLLLCQGLVSPQTPTPSLGDVALHIATRKHNVNAIKELLKWNVPCFPRNYAGMTPYEIAVQDGFEEAVLIFDAYKVPPATTKKEDWYHANITNRNEALEKLQHHKQNNGYFLLRKHSSEKDKYVMDICFDGSMEHFAVETCMSSVFISGGPLLSSLEHLVDHYSAFPDGLPGVLVAGISTSGEISSVNTHKLQLEEKTCHTNTASKTTEPIVLDPDKLEIGSELGNGEFGSVMRGNWKVSENEVIPVAIKTLHQDHAKTDKESFLSEANIMVSLNHPCIVNFIGICQSPHLMLVQELMPMGSMLDFLLKQPDKVDPVLDILPWAEQISRGMVYLEKEGFVHRDLATRNILLSTKHIAKISDFGLSRALSTKDYYKANKGGKWPIKWYAPESVLFGTFSSLSDVWSFGVTLWEMYSLGDQPYDEMTGAQVLAFLESGGRLESPCTCPREMDELMIHCWNITAKMRPNFERIFYNVQAFRMECNYASSNTDNVKIVRSKKNIFGIKLK